MRHPLAREIAVVLALKLVALLVLFFVFFGPSQRPSITPEAVEILLFDAASPPPVRTGEKGGDR